MSNVVDKNTLFNRIYQSLRGSLSQRGLSYSINVFNDLSAIAQVNVSVNNMRASILVIIKQSADGGWSISDNTNTYEVDEINQIGTIISRMVVRIRSLRTRLGG